MRRLLHAFRNSRLYLPLLILLAGCLSSKAQIDTALFGAIQRCDLPALQRIEKRVIDINAVDRNGANALMWAVYSCNLHMVKELVHHGARVGDSGFIYFKTTVYGSLQGVASCKGKLEILQYLADSLHLPLDEKELDPSTRKKDSWTPLSCAAYFGNADIVSYLLQKGVHLKAENKNEAFTALSLAVRNKQWNIFRLLMKTAAIDKLSDQAAYFMNAAGKLEEQTSTKQDNGTQIALQQFIVEITRAYFGEEHPDYLTSLHDLGRLYTNTGQYEQALALLQQSLVGRKKVLGEEHPDYAANLNNLALVYKAMGQYEKALPLYQQALDFYKKVLGEQHPFYATSLNNLALVYHSMGQYEKALPLYQQALDIRKKALGEQHPDYATSLNTLASLYQDMGQYEKALPLYQQALDIRKKVLGEQQPAYANSLNNLATLYRDMGQYEKALPLSQQALDIRKKVLGEQHPSYATSLNTLALMYQGMGQYEKALPLYQQALDIRKKALGEQHPDYANSLNNLALMYQDMGQYEKALPLYQQALDIRKKVLGEQQPAYANSLNNLVSLYKEMGQYEKALPLYQQALDINKKALGEQHPAYATSLNNLVSLYQEMGQYEKALPLYQQALDIYKKALGEQHPSYATSLNNLATLYRDMGQYEKALPLYQQALNIYKKALGEQHPTYVTNLNNLGLLYTMQDESMEAAAAFTHGNIITINSLNRTYASLSEKEKIEFLNKQSHQFRLLPSLLFSQKITTPLMTEQVYANELALKGMVLQDQQHVLRSIHQSNDNSVITTYEQWQLNKSLIGKQLLLPVAKRLPYLDSLQEATNNLEQQLSRQAVSFRNSLQSRAVTPKAISHKLLKGQAAIEFMRFQPYNKKPTDSILYAALVLLPGDSACKFVFLCEERQLKRLVERPAAIRTTGSLNDSLYKLVWEPLEKYLVGISTVYYAPAGLLHRIAFQSLHVDRMHFLVDKYRLNQVLSTRSVALPAEPTAKPALAAVWGNIDYGPQPAGLLAARGEQQDDDNETGSSFSFYNSDTRGLRNKSWPSLPGTKQEMNSISRHFKQAGIAVTTGSGAVATEEAFKALDGKSPQVLHLATHGFFLPIKENRSTDEALGKNAFTTQQNPLFRSGLVLAGGNATWKGEPTQPGKEDGILTAYEIAQMDLSNTDLVVLSACETALGDLQGNEGVFGLQRAFKLAGVKQLIVSLWKVPDAETTELMTLFYRNWLGGQTTREALRNAQLKMKAKYPPKKWAAFVLVE